MDDHALLQEYRERQSETAFAELVARHVRLVYATALRLTGESQAAQNVVQAVFLLLARKSWMVRHGRALPGWLYRTTHRTALNELRKEHRRRQRETAAMNNAELDSGASPMLAQLLPLLDEALGQLSPRDQNLIILRFFENKSLREAGAAAALSEQAAHNRIARAIKKMRRYFARSGVTVASTAVVTALTAPSSQAVPARSRRQRHRGGAGRFRRGVGHGRYVAQVFSHHEHQNPNRPCAGGGQFDCAAVFTLSQSPR